MKEEDVTGFLSRWSRRKLDKAAPAAAPDPSGASASPPAAEPAAGATPPEPLPPVESLTPESDFTPFMRPDVDPGLKQAAMKQLFKDPQFNVMDGLDTYIEDYSVPDPIPATMMKNLYQARQHLFSDEEKAAADKADADAAAALDAAAAEPESLPAEAPPPYAPDQKA
ncbi:MAG: DUF3306 domain-containing protein [Proteobacteria bacterium]|nr:DUF3306 domain-containing protein [Pseudomonadota bacterium]